MTEKADYSVLRLSPFSCMLNLMEMTRASLEFYTSKPLKVVDLTRKECKEKFFSEN